MVKWWWIAIAMQATVLCADLLDSHRYSWGPSEYLKRGFRTAPWIRDPFYPDQKKFSLKGIISNELAYINGRWVREGDKIDGYMVRSVGANSVALSKQAEMVILRLHDDR
jgi:hypothetical protein